MPKIRTERLIPSDDIEKVWQVVSAFDQYPKTMESVVSVEFKERDDQSALTEWTVLLNDSEMSWIERDVFHKPNRIDFESIDGDVEVFRGQWLLERTNNGVSVAFEVEFDLGIPSLAEVLDPIGSEALESNASSMLDAIEDALR